MAALATIDILKKNGVKDRDISMFNDHMKGGDGSSFKDLSTKYGVTAVTVSRRVKKVQKVLSDLEQGVKSGEITLQNRGLATHPQPGGSGGVLALPKENPFLALETFGELSGITSAGGSVIGMGAATLVQGFTREDLPYEDRQKMAMKGASVLVGGLLAAYLTFNQFSGLPDEKPEIKIIPEKDEDRK